MRKLLGFSSWLLVHSKPLLLFLLFLLITTSYHLPPIYAGHCDIAGNYISLNQYCESTTNTLWEDQADCSHTDTDNTCPTAPAAITPPAAVTPPVLTTTTTTGITPTTATESAEEAAVRHLDEGLRPEEIPQEAVERPGVVEVVGNFFSGIGTILHNLLSMVSFIQNSGGLARSELPEEQLANDAVLQDRISGFLGDDASKGIYNNTVPEDQLLPPGREVIVGNIKILGSEEANRREEGYEDAYFPEGCNKITTGNCNIPINP